MVRKALSRRLNDKIEAQRKGTDDKHDMLSYIIKGNLYEGKLHADDVLDDFFAFVIAGMETTAIVLGFFIFHMIKHPEIYEKLQLEVC